MENPANPCRACGACCAHFRVSFYWSEELVLGLAADLTERVDARHSCMRGTNQPQPRCVALQGEVGREASCGAYGQRPSPCRELQPGEPKCNAARARHGLAPLPAAA
jgi:Fe-S-cluster containining protein